MIGIIVTEKIIIAISPNSGTTMVPIISIVLSSRSKSIEIVLEWVFWVDSSTYGTSMPSISMMNISSFPFCSVESMYCVGVPG